MLRTSRILVAGFLLVVFGLGATEAGLLFGASWLGMANDGRCPLHTVKCCCPKVCKTPPKAKPSCHKSDDSASKVSSTQTSGDACIVKAGCDKKQHSLGYLPLLKDCLPEVLQKIDFDPNLSILPSRNGRFLLLDCSPAFFHPPRNS
jgi:hypothetical protein